MKSSSITIFARNMIARRHDMGWTQEQAAKAIGIARPTLAAYEEHRAFPSSDKLIKIAHAYGVEDLLAFISGKRYNDIKMDDKPDMKRLRKYYSLNDRDKKIIDILLID